MPQRPGGTRPRAGRSRKAKTVSKERASSLILRLVAAPESGQLRLAGRTIEVGQDFRLESGAPIDFQPNSSWTGETLLDRLATVADGGRTTQATLRLEIATINDQAIPALSTLCCEAGAEPASAARYEAKVCGADALPGWLQFENTTGRLWGSAPDGFEGSLSLKIVAFDDADTILETWAIRAEAIADESSFAFSVAELFLSRELAPPIRYQAALPDGSSLSDWIRFDTDTGLFTGEPSDAAYGMVPIRVTAKDARRAVEEMVAIMVQERDGKPYSVQISRDFVRQGVEAIGEKRYCHYYDLTTNAHLHISVNVSGISTY